MGLRARLRMVIGVSALLVGCGPVVHTTWLNRTPRPPTRRLPQSVAVFSSAAPARAHVDMALLEVRQGDGPHNTASMIRHLRERAGQLGCDAVVIGGMRERAGTATVLHDSSTTILHATCIVYVPDEPA